MAITGEEQGNLRLLLEKSAEKHGDNKPFAERCRRAADIIHAPNKEEYDKRPHYPLFFRQGEKHAPGHIVYWVRSSEKYNEQVHGQDHQLPPYYVVRLGANGDNNDCTCKDFANGAPVLNDKKYCKHVIVARTLEYLRDHPQPLGSKEELHKIINLEDPEARAEFIRRPERFAEALAAA